MNQPVTLFNLSANLFPSCISINNQYIPLGNQSTGCISVLWPAEPAGEWATGSDVPLHVRWGGGRGAGRGHTRVLWPSGGVSLTTIAFMWITTQLSRNLQVNWPPLVFRPSGEVATHLSSGFEVMCPHSSPLASRWGCHTRVLWPQVRWHSLVLYSRGEVATL
jgi:hypothetical protein